MIPEILHQIIGREPNEIVERCLKSWEVLKQVDFEIVKWNDELLETFIEEHYHFALECFINARNYAERADIARYLLIHYFGGHYIDWDVQLLDPNLFLQICEENKNGYLIIDPLNNTLASEVFSARPKNKFLIHIVEDIAKLYSTGRREELTTPYYSGPYRMRDSLEKHGHTLQSIIPVNAMFAYDYSEIRTFPEKPIHQPMIHYWLHGWIQ